MAKIDVTAIDGYSEMSAEDKVKALEAFEFADPKADTTAFDKLKAQLSKANGEAAEYKKLLREKQTDSEKAEAERAEHEKAILEELNAYKTKDRISGYTAKLMASGYDSETASAMAAGLPDGIGDDFFDKQKAFIEAQKKTIEDAAIGRQTTLTHGAAVSGKDITDPMVAAFKRAALGR